MTGMLVADAGEVVALSPTVVVAIIGCVGVVGGAIVALVGTVIARQQTELGRVSARVDFLEEQRVKTERRFMRRIEQITHWGIWALGDPPREPPAWEGTDQSE